MHNDTFLSILVYVDDLIVAGNNEIACSDFKRHLNKWFHMKDLGALRYFLGIELARGKGLPFLKSKEICVGYLKRVWYVSL